MGSSQLSGPWVVLPLAIVGLVVIGRRRATGQSWRATLARVAFWVWLAALIHVAFFPLPLPPYEALPEGMGDYRGWPYPWVSPVPFETIASSVGQGWEWPAARYLAGNIAAFVPLGVLAPVLSRRWRSWAMVLVLGLAASLSVELAQLVLSLAMGSPWRVADVDDLVLNTCGTLVGYGIWSVGRIVVDRMPSSAPA